MMDYEFHVGDYVETIDGEIGYLTKIVIDEDFINFYGVFSYNKKSFEFHYYRELLPYSFRRIGKYDFTKPEQPKEIKKLPDGYGDGYVLYKGTTEVDGSVDNGWVSIGVLSSKINDLVDAVNELRSK